MMADMENVRLDTLIHLEFEDGTFKEIHVRDCEYENDFDGMIQDHGSIIHCMVSVIPYLEL